MPNALYAEVAKERCLTLSLLEEITSLFADIFFPALVSKDQFNIINSTTELALSVSGNAAYDTGQTQLPW